MIELKSEILEIKKIQDKNNFIIHISLTMLRNKQFDLSGIQLLNEQQS